MTAIADARTAAHPSDVVGLHFVKRRVAFGTPLLILAAVSVVTAIIALALQRFGAEEGTSDAIDGARQNPAVAWALSGYVVAMGVQRVATGFPFALALGTTRRSFTAGTLLANVLQAAYFTGVLLVLLGLELVTNHWFAGIRLVDVYALGAGDVRLLVPIVFLGSLTLLSVGSLYGAGYVRFAAYGPAALGIGTGLLLAVALLIAAPVIPAIAGAFQLWWLAALAAAIVLVSAAGTLAFLRSASVR